jgi:hypothetical protein
MTILLVLGAENPASSMITPRQENKANCNNMIQNLNYNKLTGSISIATLTAGRIGFSTRRPENSC